MMKKLMPLFMFVLIISTWGCELELTDKEYGAWMAKNYSILTATDTFGDVDKAFTYLPIDWLVAKEGKNRQEGRAEYEGMEYYKLRVSLPSGQGDVLQFAANNTDEYYQRVEYFSFFMQKDLCLLMGVDTILCKLFHFERNYGTAPYVDFMLGFESTANKNVDRILLYDDKVYTQSTIRLTIPFNHIQNIPKLK